jgi:hypothetical protein
MVQICVPCEVMHETEVGQATEIRTASSNPGWESPWAFMRTQLILSLAKSRERSITAVTFSRPVPYRLFLVR